ncbi:MAG TPA: phosphate propanoyltransferase [Bacteroidota bacterium]|nr:phosphate propanoyltransferase [Bacteroidota bacterium]
MGEPDRCACTKTAGAQGEGELLDLIVREVASALRERRPAPRAQSPRGEAPLPRIPLGVSNRHIHLTEATFHRLFGAGTRFEQMRPLYQPGEFASGHTLTIVGPKLRAIPGVRILGPLRKYDQVEVSLTDAIFLGIDPPVANSGTLLEAAPLTLAGPAASVYLERCAIIAGRHIHMTPADALALGVRDGDFCRVRIGGDKSTLFERVLIRTNESWRLQIHLDTDDANAANVREDTDVEFLGKM